MYSEEQTIPLRSELTTAGFEELKTADAVEKHFNKHKGTSLVVINSICGCAAGTARPGVLHALNHTQKKPQHLTTVFAGVDKEATEKIRELAKPFPPSSPSIALFKDGELVNFVERHHIEGRTAEMISDHLCSAFEQYC